MSLTGCSERIYSFKVVWHVGVECVEETSARKWYVFVSRNTGLRHMPVTIDANSSGYFDFACWCAIAAKLRAGLVRHPERMMRFLLDNRKAMSAYPDHAAEVKARDAIRFLFPEKPYNPHG